MIINTVDSINIHLYDPEKDGEMTGYDFSTLNAVDGCACRGIIQNVLGKKFSDDTSRNMALECGDLCHKCFAMLRALSMCGNSCDENLLMKYLQQAVPLATTDTLRDLWNKMCSQLTPVSQQMVFVDYILENGGYYDDENDKKRTLANIRNTLLAYCSSFMDVVKDESVYKDEKLVGIELPFDYVVEFNYNGCKYRKVRFIGKLDGLHVCKDGSLIVHENKTASRLDDSWLGQWQTSHQITGYCLIAQAMTGKNCNKARVIGAQIPVPKMSGYAFRSERVDREDHFFENWARWVLTTVDMIEMYKDCPEIAPMSTKNCNAYYSTCALMPLCVLNRQDKHDAIDQMIVDKWSPLDE